MKRAGNIDLVLCDLDGTLIYSDALNSFAYREAARQLGIELPACADTCERITLPLVQTWLPEASESELAFLQNMKLQVFSENLDRLVLNTSLLEELAALEAEILVWTASNVERAAMMCKHFDIPGVLLPVGKASCVDVESTQRAVGEIMEMHGARASRICCYDDDAALLVLLGSLGLHTVQVSFMG